MEEKEKTTAGQAVLDAIPPEVMEDVPAHKREEFCRGVLRYMENEAPELYRQVEKASALSGDTLRQAEDTIRQFAAVVRARKKAGGEQNA